MRDAESGIRAFIVGDSLTSNSLGRVLSMAISADAVFQDVTVLAYDDGPIWSGTPQFAFDVTPFTQAEIPEVVERIRGSAATGGTLVWFSKGADPIGRIAEALQGAAGVTIVADFDDNDVAIMKSFRAQSLVNAAKMNPLRRKHPVRLARAQARLAARADALTFSNTALAGVYRARLGAAQKPWTIVPHTRRARTTPLPTRASGDGSLTLGFVGTVRAHKGAAELVELMRQDKSVTLVSFRQEWGPPADCQAQWRTYPPSTPLAELYDKIDFLVLPMDAHDEASLHQLPAKLVDAAVNGCPVAATPTPPIVEFAGDAIIPVASWRASAEVFTSLASANRSALSHAITQSFDEWFSPRATGEAILRVVRAHAAGEVGR